MYSNDAVHQTHVGSPSRHTQHTNHHWTLPNSVLDLELSASLLKSNQIMLCVICVFTIFNTNIFILVYNEITTLSLLYVRVKYKCTLTLTRDCFSTVEVISSPDLSSAMQS